MANPSSATLPRGCSLAGRRRISYYPRIEGGIVCLPPDGRSHFYNLMFRGEWPHFMAFDLLWLDGKDLRDRPLLEWERRLARIMPCVESRIS